MHFFPPGTGDEDGKEARCQAVRREALQSQIGLPKDHYLRRNHALPASLLAASTIHAMPDSSIYDLLQDCLIRYQAGI